MNYADTVFSNPVFGIVKAGLFRLVTAVSVVAGAAAPPVAPSGSQPPTSSIARPSAASAGVSRATVGMNLAGIAYWSSEHPFLDRAKNGHWSLNWKDIDDLSANGYPKALPAGTKLAFTFGVDPVALASPDRYVITYEGDASIETVIGGSIVRRKPGRIVFDAKQDKLSIVIDRMSAADPIHNVHVVREDQQAALDAGAIFNPPMLANAKHWTTLRFMDWQATNANGLVSWADRPKPDDASWGVKGVPIEVVIALANQAKADAWLNIPAPADDDYARQMLVYARDHLDPGLRVHVEYSNEVWNWAFQQTHWAQWRADQLWLATRAAEFGTFGKEGDKHINNGNMLFYGMRAAQLAKIAKSVFAAAPARLSFVLGTQTGFHGLEYYVFQGVKLGGGTDALFGEYAVTTYFGDQLGGANDADRAKVLGWARGGEAGMAAAFREIEFGGDLSSDSSLADLGKHLDYQGQIAAKHGLKLVAYEGSLAIAAASYPAGPERDELVAFAQRIEDDPRMGPLYTRMVARFAKSGGTVLGAFSDVGRASQYGTWGMLDSIYDTSVRNTALAAINGR